MKISKGTISKSTNKAAVKSSKQDTKQNNKQVMYDEAVSYIKSAMNCLNTLAKDDDEIAKDAIVNMSVIAFDLRGPRND